MWSLRATTAKCSKRWSGRSLFQKRALVLRGLRSKRLEGQVRRGPSPFETRVLLAAQGEGIEYIECPHMRARRVGIFRENTVKEKAPAQFNVLTKVPNVN